MKTLYLLDASGFLYRAYFAIGGLSNRQGESTGALFGFIRSYLKLCQEFHPTHLAAIFDGERNKESRTALFQEYKAHRRPTPDELFTQLEHARTFCELMGIPTLSPPGVEADDTIGSIAAWAKSHGAEVFICSGDKDFAQLVDDRVKIINPHKDNLVIDSEKVHELYGVAPSQMRDYLAIVGDASDNIPGIQGFGPKTAVQLLTTYGTLDAILAHAQKIGGKKGATVEAEKEVARLSQKLVTIDTSVSFPKKADFFALQPCQKKELTHFLVSKGFHTILRTLTLDDGESHHSASYHTVESLEELDKLIDRLSSAKTICFDTETTGTDPQRAQLVGIGLASHLSHIAYVPLNGKIARKSVIDRLRPLFENPHLGFFGHNVKYDLHVLRGAGIALGQIAGDTMLASYLLNAHERRHNLDDLTLSYFGKQKIPIESLIGKGKHEITMDQVPIEKVSEYCCEDVEYTFRLQEVLSKEVVQRGFEKLLHEIELPLIKVLAKMEARGIWINKDHLKTLSDEVSRDIKKQEEAIYQRAGCVFNINSPKQLAEVLFEKLGIALPRRTKTKAPSTSAQVLESLAPMHSIVEKILEYRTLEKLRSTYIDSLPNEINPKTGRIHCQFNQSVAATGRLSCQNPNLQNIPIRTPLGRSIREAFCPEWPTWRFISADYSQIELRILAHVAHDERMIAAFCDNVDIHAFTASEVFHVPLEGVTEEMRRHAKAVNFGLMYGQQAYGLSQSLQISVQEAQSFIDRYFARYKKVKDCLEEIKRQAYETGKAVTLTGRERLLPDIRSTNQAVRLQAERLAVNAPFQGTAADIIKMAMIHIDRWAEEKKLQGAMLLQIHDELLFEVPYEEVVLWQESVRQYMEGAFPLSVPLTVEIVVGKNWKECYS